MYYPRDRQVSFNASSRAQREAFTGHRAEVMALLGTGKGRICIVGAGNGNDLDLPALLGAYREVHLIDIDSAALDFAAHSQGVANHPSLHVHGGIDVTGVPFSLCRIWSPCTSITPRYLQGLADWPADRLAGTLPGGFDVVASTCMISQLMETARHLLGDSHSSLKKVERAIRIGHLRLLARMAAPTGSAILITEVTSSEFVPWLANVSKHDLPSLLSDVGQNGGYYRCTHPSDLAATVHSDHVLRTRSRGVVTATPWKWKLFNLCFLVSAITIQFGATDCRREFRF
jgi:hypothetical protein